MTYHPWTQPEIDFALAHRNDMSLIQIGSTLNRNPNCVGRKGFIYPALKCQACDLSKKQEYGQQVVAVSGDSRIPPVIVITRMIAKMHPKVKKGGGWIYADSQYGGLYKLYQKRLSVRRS